MNKKSPTKKIKKAACASCIVYIKTTDNNILMYATNPALKVIAWSSAGAAGFKGFRKSTPFAAQETATDLANKLKEFKVQTISCVLNGLSANRDAAILKLKSHGFAINAIMEKTSYAFGGCRPPKARSV